VLWIFPGVGITPPRVVVSPTVSIPTTEASGRCRLRPLACLNAGPLAINDVLLLVLLLCVGTLLLQEISVNTIQNSLCVKRPRISLQNGTETHRISHQILLI
jgi:hypothetical protein